MDERQQEMLRSHVVVIELAGLFHSQLQDLLGPGRERKIPGGRGRVLPAEVRREPHGGAYPGQHGVYILHSDVELEAAP